MTDCLQYSPVKRSLFGGMLQKNRENDTVCAIIPRFASESRDYCTCLYDIFAETGSSFCDRLGLAFYNPY